ncbi:hypothetical protein EU803_15630 [Loktanella sp. IMCC34160]|uniref:hypothetical protein n=1 Tax=Loktanella sp. IMCC34160 TaxID=2510646 RepID=UPI00101CB0B7|nr:hypothetical protein [Loktanella sp. IMCC34160]RYG90044.1 hypothetical protein EU803_15630 [Loktanella sp. IMCC34160]
MAAYEFVLSTDDGLVTVYSDDVAEFAEAMDTEIVGINVNPRQRPELQGHPRLSGYAGPCWGGTTATGEPIIRYEDSHAHRALSM